MSAVKSLKGRLNKASAPSERVLVVKLADIRTEPQVRRKFDSAALAELAASIKARGLMQPIVVRETPSEDKPYTVHVGERRYRACLMAGLDTLQVIVREIDPKVARIEQFIENADREDLTLLEEIEFVAGELKTMSGAELAAALGKPTTWVSKRKTLSGAGPATLRVIENEISGDMEAIYQFSKLEKSNPDKARAFVDEVESGGVSAENFRDQVKALTAPQSEAPKNEEDKQPEQKTTAKVKDKGPDSATSKEDDFYHVTAVDFEEDYIKVTTEQGILIFDKSLSDFMVDRSG